MDKLKKEVGFSQRPNYLSTARLSLMYYVRFLYSMPVIGLLSHPAFYSIVLLFLFALVCVKQLKKVLLVLCPLILSLGVIILAPVIQGHPRYAFPIIYSMPVVIAYYIYESAKQKDN